MYHRRHRHDLRMPWHHRHHRRQLPRRGESSRPLHGLLDGRELTGMLPGRERDRPPVRVACSTKRCTQPGTRHADRRELLISVPDATTMSIAAPRRLHRSQLDARHPTRHPRRQNLTRLLGHPAPVGRPVRRRRDGKQRRQPVADQAGDDRRPGHRRIGRGRLCGGGQRRGIGGGRELISRRLISRRLVDRRYRSVVYPQDRQRSLRAGYRIIRHRDRAGLAQWWRDLRADGRRGLHGLLDDLSPLKRRTIDRPDVRLWDGDPWRLREHCCRAG